MSIFWPSTLQDIKSIDPINSSHDVMEAYLRENVPTIEDYYVGPLCSRPKDDFSSKEDIVEGQMLIVRSPDLDCAIWLGMARGSVHQDPYATIYLTEWRFKGGIQ